MSQAMVHQLRVTCLTGPWFDDECVRFIELSNHVNLYDLHVAIQEAVDFDEAFPFYFFTARTFASGRTLIPEGLSLAFDPEIFDPDVYEDCRVFDYVTEESKKSLFYIFGSAFNDWVFKIQHTGTSHNAVQGEFYPLVCHEFSIGPDPKQYGSGFDDFAEAEEAFQPDPRPISNEEDSTDDNDDRKSGFFGLFSEDVDDS